jgi:hypothetical protein
MRRVILVFLSLALITGSCYYTDVDSYFVEVEKDLKPVVNITTNFDGQEDLFVIDSIKFIYNIEVDIGEIFFAELLLNNQRFFITDEFADSLWIKSDLVIFPGEYDLKMLAYYKTMTGSLADIVDAEIAVSQASWKISF